MSGPGRASVDWNEVRHLFEEALDRPAGQRDAWLEQHCERAEVRRAVQELLAAEAASEGLFEAPASAVLADWIAGEREPTLPRSLGPYRLLEELGRGGMGTVYLAEHAGPGFERRVAVKVLRRGLDTVDVLARFATERRVLAGLQHPHIAQLLDAGTTPGGRPYLVMEAVAGVPITEYCDRHRLSVERRLRLVLDVASAIQAAHSRLVVHRDLKPSNLLVTEEGHVKLLDFGIAKLLDADPDDSSTRTGQLLLTPQYAAPEQLRGEPVSIATDVYQLGAILLRLLTGEQPLTAVEPTPSALRELADTWQPPQASSRVSEAASPDEIAAARSTTPRALAQSLYGDLDTVLAKALHPEPDRRYGSAAELAADLRAHLEGRPISARPDTLAYRTRKFLGRHPWVAPGVVLLLVGVLVFALVVARYTRQLEAARTAAEAEAARANEVQELLVGMFRSADIQAHPDVERGPRLTVVEAMDQGIERLRVALSDRPRVRADLLLAIAQTYQGLGETAKGLPVAEEALELYVALDGESSENARTALGLVGYMLRDQAATRPEAIERAEDLLRRRLELALAAQPADPGEVAAARVSLGHLYRDTAQTEAAEEQLLAVLALEGPTAESTDEEVARYLGEAARVLADVRVTEGRGVEAEQLARRAMELKRRVYGEPSQQLALVHGTLAAALRAQGRYGEAEEHFVTAVEWLERVAGEAYGDRLVFVNNHALMLLGMGELERADEMFSEAISLAEQARGPDHSSVGDLLQNRGVLLTQLGRLEEAREAHERAAEIFTTARAPTDPGRAFPDLSLAGVWLALERPEEGLAAAERALAVLTETLPGEHFAIAVARCRRARSLVALGRSDQAERPFAEATAVLAETGTPEYRRECLEAAAEWEASRGRTERAAQLRRVSAEIEE